MLRIIDWILDGLARWRAVDPSVVAAQYVPPPHAYLLDEHPLVKFWTWFRRLTIRRKARHYLKYIRETYGIAE